MAHRALMVSMALLASAFTAPAIAEPLEVVITVTAHKAGAPMTRALRHRVALAVEQVCGSYATVERDEWYVMDGCYKQAWHSVARQYAALEGDGAIRLAAR